MNFFKKRKKGKPILFQSDETILNLCKKAIKSEEWCGFTAVISFRGKRIPMGTEITDFFVKVKKDKPK